MRPGPMQPLIDGGFGDAEADRDLGDRELLEVEQQDGFPQRQRHPANLLAQPVQPLLADVGGRALFHRHRQVDILDLHLDLPRAAEPIDADVVGNPMHVRSEPGWVFETRQATEGPQEGLLNEVIQVPPSPQPRHADPAYRPRVADYQESEGLA